MRASFSIFLLIHFINKDGDNRRHNGTGHGGILQDSDVGMGNKVDDDDGIHIRNHMGDNRDASFHVADIRETYTGAFPHLFYLWVSYTL